MKSPRHKLAVIMFTDIEGYSKLMGEDENNALDTLNRNFEIQKPLVEKYDGTYLKEMGDGTFLSFQSITDAICCAIEIQKHAIAQKIRLRIGLHLGEVMEVGKEIIGDGVNIAAKLEKVGIPGSIIISQKVNDELVNKGLETVALGPINLKNILKPVYVFALKFDGLCVPKKHQILHGEIRSITKAIPVWLIFLLALVIVTSMGWIFSKKGNTANLQRGQVRIAVLHFNFHGDENLEYIGNGLMELISNEISDYKGITVIDPDVTELYYRRGNTYAKEFQSQQFIKDHNVGYFISGFVVQTTDSFQFYSMLTTSFGEEVKRMEYSSTDLGSLLQQIDKNLIDLLSTIPGVARSELSEMNEQTNHAEYMAISNSMEGNIQ